MLSLQQCGLVLKQPQQSNKTYNLLVSDGGATVGGWPFSYVVLPFQDKLSARSAAVAADVHVAVISALLVTTASAVLAPVTCDLGVEQRQRHL